MANERILLVDDEVDFTEALSKRLRARGMTVHTAPDGYTALEVAAKERLDAIVLDLKMPGMDGLETLRRLMNDDKDLQVILLTGYASIKSSVQAVREGAVDVLEKPVDMALLLEKIGAAAAQRIVLLEKRSQESIEDILQKKSW